MKKTLFAASLLVAGIAFADSTTVEASYTLGVLPVTLSAGQTEAIIGIPWVESGTGSDVAVGDQGIAVSNLVKTANLTAGDMLYWYDTANSKYKMWYLSNTTPKYWQAVQTNGDGATFEGSAYWVRSDATVLKRGEAVLLQRNNNNPGEATIYVLGQYEGGGTDTITIAAKGASGTRSKVTMIAPPKTEASSLNDATWENVGASDTIFLRSAEGGLVEGFIYKNGKWGKETPSATPGAANEFVTTDTIPVGFGVFYVSDTATDTPPTVKWTGDAE